MPNGAVEVATAIAAVLQEPIDRDFVARHVREILHPDDAERRLEIPSACFR